METIPVRYSCRRCGLRDVTVLVPTREAGESVVAWTRIVLGGALERDHERLSPGCIVDEVSDVKIPVDGRTMIGGPFAM